MGESYKGTLTRVLVETRHYMGNLASDFGLTKGSSDYVKFLVLGRSRTGSNLLRSLLNAHPQVEAYGEIFRNRDAMDWDHTGYLQSSAMHGLVQSNPVKFVNTWVFRRYSRGTEAVGFKLFYYHAQEGEWSSIWPYLRESVDIRVIHVKRRNILETHLSRKQAEITDSWVSTDGKLYEAPPVALDYQECLADFERTRALEERYDEFFSEHPKLEVTYEGLARDFRTEMDGVFKFLGVRSENVRPGIYKQSSGALRDRIANYGELKQIFAGSPWESFFVD